MNSIIKATNEFLDKIATEMNEWSKSLEFTQSRHDEELGSIRKDIIKLESNIKSIEKDLSDPDEIFAKLIKLECRPWRSNLRIDGLQQTPNETWKTCEEKV